RPRSIRRETSSMGLSVKGWGARLLALSMVSWTSAWLRGGRPAAPAKITSSMPWPRMALAELAPMTQRRLSSTFDLPQPFGPTMPVSPASICTSAGSTKDLKPTSRRRWNCIASRSARPDQRVDGRRQGLQRMVADPLAVDEEGGRAGHPGRHGALDLGLKGLAGRGVLHTGFDLFLAAAAGGDGGGEPVAGVALLEGGRLTAHQAVGDIEEAVRRGAARYARRRRRDLGRRRGHVAKHQPHLAGVDVARLELRQGLIGPGGAVVAGEGGVFDHRHRGVGPTQHAVGGRDRGDS